MRQLLTFLFCLLCLPLSAATWYLNVNKTGTSLNTGTSWEHAYTNVMYISDTNELVAGDDIVLVSAGTYQGYMWTRSGWTSSTNTWGLPKGTPGHPVKIYKDETAGHAGMAIFPIGIIMDPEIIFDMRKDRSATNFSSPWDIFYIATNCGAFLDNSTSNTIGSDNMALIGSGPSTNVVYGCIFNAKPGYSYPDFQACGIGGSQRSHLTGLDFGYNVFTNYSGAWCINFNQNQATPEFGQWKIHHSYFGQWGTGLRFDHPENAYGSAEVVSGGTGLDLYYNVCGDWPNMPFEDDVFQLGWWWRIWDNIIYPGGNSMMQADLNGTNASHIYFYRNILTYVNPADTNWQYGTTRMQFNSVEDGAVGLTNMTIADWRFFNNTIICVTTNAPNGFLSFLNREWHNKRYPHTFWMTVGDPGVYLYNNLVYTTNSALGSIGMSPQNYEGLGELNGWGYDTNSVKVDYNIFSGIGYNSNYNRSGAFTTTEFKAWSGFTNNTDTMPSLAGLYTYDYRPQPTDTIARAKGIDLTAWATNMPGLITDFYGTPAGIDGAWSIGACEPNSLKVWLRFTNDFSAANITDSSGNGNVGVRMSITNWPYATNGPKAGVAGAYYSATRAYYDAFTQGDYIALTNLTGIDYLTNGTIALWSFADANSYGSSVLIGNLGTVGTGVESNCWAIARSGSENWRFRLRYAGGMEGDDTTNAIYFPIQAAGQYYETNWTHYSVTWASDGVNILVVGYYNGSPYATNTLPIPWLRADNSQEGTPWIGVGVNPHDGTPQMDRLTGGDEFPNNGWYGGRIADVRIYNRALSASEITDVFNYNGGTTPPAAPSILTIQNTTIDTLYLR